MAIGKLFGRKPADEAPPEEPVVEPEEVAPEPERPPLSIVVVDDDVDVRELMTMALERGGFTVLGEAANAAEALRVVGETQPDLVLLDLHMPDASGLEVMPALKEASRRTKFVMLSAISATYMVEAAIDAGVVGFIEKGVSPRTILLHLERVASSGPVKVVRPYPLNREIG